MLTNTRPLTSARSTTSLAAVDERVERPDDVVAIDPEIEREVVPGAGRDARVREVELGGDHRDDRLRAVSARHRERVSSVAPTASRTSCLQVVAAVQLDRLDPAPARLVGQLEALRLAAAGQRVVEQDRVRRRDRWGQLRMQPERHPRRRQRAEDRRDH